MEAKEMKESILVNRLLGSGTTTHKCPKSGKHVSGDRVGMSPEFKGKNHGNPKERGPKGLGQPEMGALWKFKISQGDKP